MSTNKVLLVGHVLHWCILVLTTTVHTSGIGESGGHSRNEGEKKLKLPGDIIFGGLFPMHEKGPVGKNCGKVKEEKGIQRMEAMLYAVDKINNDDSILPNITLGVHILDTCSRDSYALEQSMDFIRAQFNNFDEGNYQCKDGRLRKYVKSRPVAGVIGAASSSVSVMVANILRLFK
ncbi:metabotropic glutamate receptor-like, partial [Lingula anatina]